MQPDQIAADAAPQDISVKEDYVPRPFSEENIKQVYQTDVIEVDVIKDVEAKGLPYSEIVTVQFLKYLKDIKTVLDQIEINTRK